jgi:hypothetical protein
MPRRARLYLPLDVNFFLDDRVLAIDDSAKILFLRMCVHCKMTGSDGRVSPLQLEALGHLNWKIDIDELLRVELVVHDYEMDAYFIRAWFEWNEPISHVMKRRADDLARKQRPRKDS